MWKAQFDQAAKDPAIGDWQRSVLLTYQITDAQYREALDGFSRCMADLGWKATMNADGTYHVEALPGTVDGLTDDQQIAKNNADNVTCQNQWTKWITALYLQMQANPNGLSFGQQVRACYAQHGVPDGDGLSDDAFQAMVLDPTYVPSTPEAVLCWWDPTGSNGYTLAQAETYQQNSKSGGGVLVPSPTST